LDAALRGGAAQRHPPGPARGGQGPPGHRLGRRRHRRRVPHLLHRRRGHGGRSSGRPSRGHRSLLAAHLLSPSVLVIAELGYLPLDQASANWIFQVVSRRYEKGSIVLTSNRGFGDWNQVFADPVVASAIVDRLLHTATVLNIRGASYRMRAYVAQQKLKGGGAMVG